MLYTVKNTAKNGPRGVNTVGGATVYIMPGETVGPLAISAPELKAMRAAAPWLEVADYDGKPTPAPQPHPDDAARIINPTNDDIARHALAEGGLDDGEAGEPVKPNFDAMTDAALRAYLTDAEISFHPATGHDKLVAKASETYDRLQAQAEAAATSAAEAAAAAAKEAGEPIV